MVVNNTNEILDYIFMDASDRIDFRHERSMTVMDWINSLRPQRLEGLVSTDVAAELLGTTRKYINNQIRAGKLLGATRIEPENRLSPYQIPAETLNQIIEREALLVDVKSLCERVEQLNFTGRNTYKNYSSLFERRFVKYYSAVSLANAARIIFDLKSRKNIMENWIPARDISKMLPDGFQMYRWGYLEAIKNGEINAKMVTIPTNGGVSREWRASPASVRRFIEAQINTFPDFLGGANIKEIAEDLNISTCAAYTAAYRLRKEGVIEKSPVSYLSAGWGLYFGSAAVDHIKDRILRTSRSYGGKTKIFVPNEDSEILAEFRSRDGSLVGYSPDELVKLYQATGYHDVLGELTNRLLPNLTRMAYKVRKLAYAFGYPSLEVDDLTNEGYFGFQRAAEIFPRNNDFLPYCMVAAKNRMISANMKFFKHKTVPYSDDMQEWASFHTKQTF